jgi:hypothetical protein
MVRLFRFKKLMKNFYLGAIIKPLHKIYKFYLAQCTLCKVNGISDKSLICAYLCVFSWKFNN